MTVYDALQQELHNAASFNENESVAPSAIIWTDEGSFWLKLIPQLREKINIFTLGDYCEESQQGPDSYLRYMLGKQHDSRPVLYLPGVSKSNFRAANQMPRHAKHLFGLQYLAQFWLQKSHKDWTPLAFLQSAHGGLNLDVAVNKETKEALLLALPEVLDYPISKLQGKKLEANDFHALCTPDSVKEVLNWMKDPDKLKNWPESRKAIFIAECKSQYKIHPEEDGVITGIQMLATGNDAWAAVWDRFCEAPSRYPGILAALDLAQPETQDLFTDQSRWPIYNQKAEAELATSLKVLTTLSPNDAKNELQSLAEKHHERTTWIWAELGKSPLAKATQILHSLANLTSKSFHYSTWDELKDYYDETGWKIDNLMLKALELAHTNPTTEAIQSALDAIYAPWLEDIASHCLSLSQSYPTQNINDLRSFPVNDGTIYLFVDGLRYDIGKRLLKALDQSGKTTQFTQEWAALPSVTATAKPAWRPLADYIHGNYANPDFAPSRQEDGKELTTARFRKLLEKVDIVFLKRAELGDPHSCAWTECADLDHLGHQEGWKLAQSIDTQIKLIVERVQSLLSAGWTTIEIVTDHGWLLSASSLAKEELPGHLTESKWGRCALPQPGAQHGLHTIPWLWHSEQDVVIPSGSHCFRKNYQYSHGGLSLQECCIPRITIKVDTTSPVTQTITVNKLRWAGLRLKLEIDTASDLTADIRTKANSPETSVALKPVKIKDGKASLLVEDDSLEATAALLVIITPDNHVIYKTPVTIAENF